ncbi:hypothetical protein M1O47_03775 [Dehalococcoidia bacterium]|nr:hypothetical protein [Dehalococcoidia bacterium]
MRLKTTFATEFPTIGIYPRTTSWASMARSPFILRNEPDPILSELVFYLEPDPTEGPLMDLLIGLLPIVGTLADMGGISINHRRDTICPAGLDKMTGYLVLGILYAVIDFLESSSLELEKFSFSVTALLFSAEFGMEGGFHLFPVLFLGTERPAVIDGALFSIEDSNGMYLSRINSNSLTIRRNGLRLMCDYQSKIVAIIPDNFSHSGMGKNLALRDRNNNWRISFTTGKLNISISKVDCRALEGNAKVFGPSQGRFGFGISFLIPPVALEGGKVFLYNSLGSLGMEFIGFDDFLHLRLFEPDTLLAVDLVNVGDGFGIDPTTFLSKCIKLLSLIELNGDGAITNCGFGHRYTSVWFLNSHYQRWKQNNYWSKAKVS